LDEERLVERVIDALRSTGILRSSDRIVVEDQINIPYAYVVFDFNREPSLRTIHAWMESVDLYPCGRFGEWGYHWSFEAIESGKRVAEKVALSRQRSGAGIQPSGVYRQPERRTADRSES
jgi:protoporphyrinogen oxidase